MNGYWLDLMALHHRVCICCCGLVRPSGWRMRKRFKQSERQRVAMFSRGPSAPASVVSQASSNNPRSTVDLAMATGTRNAPDARDDLWVQHSRLAAAAAAGGQPTRGGTAPSPGAAV